MRRSSMAEKASETRSKYANLCVDEPYDFILKYCIQVGQIKFRLSGLN